MSRSRAGTCSPTRSSRNTADPSVASEKHGSDADTGEPTGAARAVIAVPHRGAAAKSRYREAAEGHSDDRSRHEVGLGLVRRLVVVDLGVDAQTRIETHEEPAIPEMLLGREPQVDVALVS